MAEKFWHGDPPISCDLTGEPITTEFVDGRTSWGPWAIMSPEAHTLYGTWLGLGNGQLYRKQPDGRWLKVKG